MTSRHSRRAGVKLLQVTPHIFEFGSIASGNTSLPDVFFATASGVVTVLCYARARAVAKRGTAAVKGLPLCPSVAGHYSTHSVCAVAKHGTVRHTPCD